MPTRTLRKETIDNALLAGDSEDETDPPLPETKTTVSDGQVVSGSLHSCGLDNDVKKKLLMSLEQRGGLQAIPYDNCVFALVCDANVKDFGSSNGKTPRRRRKQCQNFIQKLREMPPAKANATRCKIMSDNVFVPSYYDQETEPSTTKRRKVVAKKPTKQPTKTAPATLSSLISPIKTTELTTKMPTKTAKSSRSGSFTLEGSKQIQVDATRPENHFPLKVFPFTNALVNEGKHMVSSVDIKYRSHIADVCNDRVKASIGGESNNIFKVDLPLLDHVEITEYDKMITLMKSLQVHNDVIQDQEQTAMMEMLENEDRHNHSFYMDFGTELITETMITDGTTGCVLGEEVDYFLVPMETSHKMGGKTFRTHTCEVTWRIGFATTLWKKTKTTKKKGKGSAKVADLISGMSSLGI